jgi:hypothetical protein
VEKELSEICASILQLLDEHLIPTASTGESKVFYLKMKGDYHRYLAEFKTSADRKEAAEHTLLAYKAAQVSQSSHRWAAALGTPAAGTAAAVTATAAAVAHTTAGRLSEAVVGVTAVDCWQPASHLQLWLRPCCLVLTAIPCRGWCDWRALADTALRARLLACCTLDTAWPGH